MSTIQVVVIDGMGGGIGKTIVERLSQDIQGIHLIAAGTNPVALQRMLEAGANEGGTGETSVISYLRRADVIVGAMGILIPNGLSGEMTQNIVLEICACKAIKLLIPMDKCGIRVATDKKTIGHYINCVVKELKELSTAQ